MRMFTVKKGVDIEVKSSESDHFVMLRAQQDMHFFREDIYVDPIGNLTQDDSLQPLGDDGYYVFRSDGMDVKVFSNSVEVIKLKYRRAYGNLRLWRWFVGTVIEARKRMLRKLGRSHGASPVECHVSFITLIEEG